MRLSTGETWFKMLDYMTCTLYRYWWKDLSPNSFGTGDSPRDLRDFLSQSGLIDHVGIMCLRRQEFYHYAI